MATQAASPTSTSVLRRNALGLPQVVFQGITHIAPSINVVFTFPVIALKAGPTRRSGTTWPPVTRGCGSG